MTWNVTESEPLTVFPGCSAPKQEESQDSRGTGGLKVLLQYGWGWQTKGTLYPRVVRLSLTKWGGRYQRSEVCLCQTRRCLHLAVEGEAGHVSALLLKKCEVSIFQLWYSCLKWAPEINWTQQTKVLTQWVKQRQGVLHRSRAVLVLTNK